jgi:hypothetical protein
MTQAFTPNGNATDYLSIADDSTNYTAILNSFTGSYGSALWVTNLEPAGGNVIYVSAGWDEFDTAAIVPVVGTPGQGVAIVPQSTVILNVNTTQQATGSHSGQLIAPLYFAAAVDGTADLVVVQGSVK